MHIGVVTLNAWTVTHKPHELNHVRFNANRHELIGRRRVLVLVRGQVNRQSTGDGSSD